MDNITSFYFGVYIDRALTLLAVNKMVEVTDDEGQEWSFDEWFASGGDLERVGRTLNIANQLSRELDLSGLALSEVCYEILEYRLVEFIERFGNNNLEAPTDSEICVFIQAEVDKLKR